MPQRLLVQGVYSLGVLFEQADGALVVAFEYSRELAQRLIVEVTDNQKNDVVPFFDDDIDVGLAEVLFDEFGEFRLRRLKYADDVGRIVANENRLINKRSFNYMKAQRFELEVAGRVVRSRHERQPVQIAALSSFKSLTSWRLSESC